MRSILRGHFCRPFTIRAGRFGAFRDGLVQPPDGGGIDHIHSVLRVPKSQTAPPEAGGARLGNHPVQHLPDGAQTAATIPQRRQMPVPLGAVHMTQGRMIEFLLVAEGIAKALPPDPHGVDQHFGRAARKSIFGEHPDRCLQRPIFVE
jgi:hypothetical protein